MSELRWRIPPDGDPHVLRLRLAQTGLATVVCALVLLVAAPREILGGSLVALVPLAIFLAFRQWRHYRRLLTGPDNTWLDEAGVHWLDSPGHERLLPRADIVGFRVGEDDDTLRPVPALTLVLTGGRESQPLELHPPAMPDKVRRILAAQWQIEELPVHSGGRQPGYDRAIDVYSECHDEFQQWHFEGSAAALSELFDMVLEVAALPLSPPGVKAARRVVLARRREAVRLSIEHDRHTRIDGDTIAGTAETLVNLAARGRETLTKELPATGERDLKFDLAVGRGGVWTFHLHLQA